MPVDSTLQVGGLFIPGGIRRRHHDRPAGHVPSDKNAASGIYGMAKPKTIIDGKEYVNNALFSTNIQSGGEGDKEWLDFKSAYRARYSIEPERIAAMGFDAASLVLQ